MRRVLALAMALVIATLPSAALAQERVVRIVPSAEGGLKSHISPYLTPENAAVEADNVRINSQYGSVSSREVLVSEIDMGTGPVNGLYRYYKANGDTHTVAALGTYLKYDASGTATNLNASLTDGKRFSFVTYKDMLIAANGTDATLKWDGLTATTANTTACRTAGDLMAELGAPFCQLLTGANLDASKWYQYKVAFYNGTTYSYSTARSNPIATGADVRDIRVTGIPIGPTGTTHRYIYRTLGDANRAAVVADSTYYLVKDLADNSTTTFDDTMIDDTADDGAAPTWATVSAGSNCTPPKSKYLEICTERLFFGDVIVGSTNYYSSVYWSDDGNPDYVTSTSFTEVRPDDGDKITFLKTFLGILTVGKTNTIQKFYTEGSSATDWTLSNPFSFVGCPAPYTASVTPLGIFYLGRHGLYRFSGQAAELISDSVTDVIDDISQTNIAECVGQYWNGEYHLAYASDSSSSAINNRVLVYDIVRNAYVSDSKSVNCFAAFGSGTDYGTLYSGSSTTDGYVFAHSPTAYTLTKKYKSELDAGTFSRTSSSGTEDAPILTMSTIDDMETYTSNALARTAYTVSETTDSKKVPADLGSGADGASTVSADTTLSAGEYNYTSLTVDAGITLTAPGNVIKCLGTVTVNGTLICDTIYAQNVVVGAAGAIQKCTTIKANVINVDATGSLETAIYTAANGGTLGGSANEACRDNDWATSALYMAYSGSGSGSETATISFPSCHISRVKYGVGGDGNVGYATGQLLVNSTSVNSGSASGGGSWSLSLGGSGTDYTNSGVGWDDITSITVIIQAGSSGGEGRCYLYEMQAYSMPYCYYKSAPGAGTVPTSGSTTDFVNALDVFSDSTLKSQGDYSLKVVVPPGADTLNETITKTITATNLSNYSTITGSIDPTASTDVTGVGTLFLTELIVGDSIRVNTETRVVDTITSDTALTVTQAFTDTANDAALQKVNYSTVLVDVYALRDGTQFQMGIGEAALTDLVNVTVAASNTWETVAITGLTDADVDAATTIGFKFTNTDTGNVVYIDNIRPATTKGFWLSPVYDINSSVFKKLYWNENLNTYGDVVWNVRTSASATCSGAAWNATAYSSPSGSDISALSGLRYVQLRATLSTTDTTTYLYPWVYNADGYFVRASYSKVGSNYETTVSNVWKTGWRNLGVAGVKKWIKRVWVYYEGEGENLTVNIKGDDYNVDQSFTIDMSVLPDDDTTDRYTGTSTHKIFTWDAPINSDADNALISESFQFTATHNGDEFFRINQIRVLCEDQPLY